MFRFWAQDMHCLVLEKQAFVTAVRVLMSCVISKIELAKLTTAFGLSKHEMRLKSEEYMPILS